MQVPSLALWDGWLGLFINDLKERVENYQEGVRLVMIEE